MASHFRRKRPICPVAQSDASIRGDTRTGVEHLPGTELLADSESPEDPFAGRGVERCFCTGGGQNGARKEKLGGERIRARLNPARTATANDVRKR